MLARNSEMEGAVNAIRALEENLSSWPAVMNKEAALHLHSASDPKV
jgi:hypothetical protein